MRKTLPLAALLAALFASGAQADDDFRCGNVPLERWMSQNEITERARKMGVDVRRVEIDDGCYEVSGRNRDGRRVEIRLHPETGAQVSVDSD